MADRHTLIFSKPTTSAHPVSLPSYITRHYIPTPLGTLELLAAEPPATPESQNAPRKKAILFQHGGFGSAPVFLPFLTYFSQQHQHPAYALSVRGHGASWTPSFLRMVWGYPKSAFAADLQAGVQFVLGLEAEKRGEEVVEDLVLVGHSAGGGLTQFALSEGLVRVGGWRCYWNWFKMDPWFVPRYYIRDIWHPRSPLSSTTLVHQAFFSPSYPVSEVRKFESLMPEYESMLWPLQMMTRFVDVGRVVRSVVGWGRAEFGKENGDGEGRIEEKRMLIIAGEKDMLMGVELMRRMAAEYREAVRKGWGSLVSETDRAGGNTSAVVSGGPGEEDGVGFEVVLGSGHHVQNDLYWEDCAGKILEFVEQL
ncbi:Alpha/Beta hydrolase protein [Cadophora sp. MPI-SDFR-AT-0126]|nr:Alpha/Beta hydrolase protein [Leotiomycetes sp. MPI-SDFR-AT-0126]